MKALYQKLKKTDHRAQAIVEFAIVAPILLMMLFGVLEVGRLIYVYAVVNNASRDAARYASAVGLADDGVHRKYNYCVGIENAAKRFAYFMPGMDISIRYDKGPNDPFYTDGHGPDNDAEFDPLPACSDTISVSPGDRVIVRVRTTYTPFINLLPIRGRTFESISARTILGDVNLTTGVSSIPVGGGSVPGGGTGPGGGGSVPSNTPTNTPTDTPTATNTPTATPTSTAYNGPWASLTPFDTFTPSATLAPSVTPSMTPTPTMTFTPTATSTPVPGCGSVRAGPVMVNKGTRTMTMTITNPHDTMTVLSVGGTWNNTAGGPSGAPLALKSIALNSFVWTWAGTGALGPSETITPTDWTLRGNNIASIITFTFDKNYQIPNGTEKIWVTLSAPGCEPFQIPSP